MKNIHKLIIKDLIKLGVRPGGVLLVHSSLHSLGNFPNKANIIIDSLLQTLGKNGTLLMPALSYEAATVENPNFEVNDTPSCVGALTEIFRNKDNVLRSVHPTHSVCGLGHMAKDILKSHVNDTTPCGDNSPYFKLKELKGQILFLGCGLSSNTTMHAIEELVEPPYLFGDFVKFNITLGNGSTTFIKTRCHNFDGWEQRYDRLEQVLFGDALRQGKILEADSYLVEVYDMWEKVHNVLKDDPLYFVDKK